MSAPDGTRERRRSGHRSPSAATRPASRTAAADAGAPADAFHLVIPSIPGYGFSCPLSGGGWNLRRIAGARAELMDPLGCQRYGAQGGRVVGVPVNLLLTFGSPEGLDEADRERLAGMERFTSDLGGHLAIQFAHAWEESEPSPVPAARPARRRRPGLLPGPDPRVHLTCA